MENEDRYTIVSIKNIDTENFSFAYNKRPYQIAAGEVRRFPKFLAEHCMKHLIDHLLNKKEIQTNHPTERASLAEQIYISEEKFEAPPVKNEDEVVAEQVEKLNRPTDLENILSKKREEIDATATIEEVSQEDFEGLKPTPPPATIIVGEKGGEAKTEPIKAPTKEDIKTYVINEMKLKFDKNMEEEFAKKSIPQLIKTFTYPI